MEVFESAMKSRDAKSRDFENAFCQCEQRKENAFERASLFNNEFHINRNNTRWPNNSDPRQFVRNKSEAYGNALKVALSLKYYHTL